MKSCCRIAELQNKEVICIKTGSCLGRVCDVEVDTCNGKLVAVVVLGRTRFFGIFGREDDYIIPWDGIEVVGDDTILVDFEIPHRPGKRGGFWGRIFG